MAFHDVLNHEAKSFRDKLIYLKKVSNVISLDDFFADKMSWRKVNVVITFDDGYRGWFDNAFPVLKDLGMAATFFVSSGFVGLQGEEEREYLRNNLRSNLQTTGSIGAEELRKIAEEGFTIGSHTKNHTMLSELFNINELRSEIQNDKKVLESITGTRIEYFAYPFGFHRNATVDLAQALREFGYRGAVTTVPGFNKHSMDRYFLRRDLTSAFLPMSVFKARLLGNHDGVMFVRKIIGL